MFDKEVTIAVLDKNENLLGFLNPESVKIPERRELYKQRTVTITCQLIDETNTDPSKYDSWLVHGNKIYRESTTDGDSCAYVIRGDKEYTEDNFFEITVEAVELSSELSQNKLTLSDSFSWTVDSSFIDENAGELFDPGTLTGPDDTITEQGCLTPMAILQEIQEKTGGEFQFRYEYDLESKTIKRYIDFLETVGVDHEGVIEIGHNAKGIRLVTTEDEVGSAAGPTGKPSGSTDDFLENMKAFEDLIITKGQMIPLYYTKDENGDPVPGPLAAAPYAKPAGQMWVECDEDSERVASYDTIQPKAGGSGDMRRIITFTTSESLPIAIYWECVDTIRDHLQPKIEIGCSLVNLLKLQGSEDYYNIGDRINIMIPTGSVIQCRITSTTKDPRDPSGEQIEIKTYNTTFLQAFYQNKFKNPNSVIF